MRTTSVYQKGFAPLVIVAAIVVVGLIIGVGVVVSQRDNTKNSAASTTRTAQSAGAVHKTNATVGQATAVTDPDKQKIIALLVKDCGAGAEKDLAASADDASKFVVKGYFARVNVQCEGGGFQAYFSKDDAGNWVVIEKTQQAPNCANFDNSVGLSSEIVTTCYDGNTLKERDVQF